MAAQLWVTGAVALFVKAPFDSTALFLGHGERAPSIEFSPEWEPVVCDLSGRVPLDFVYAGEKARLSVDLIRFDMGTLGRLKTRARSVTFPTAVAGYDLPGMRGTLAITEGSAYTVWAVQSFANKPVFSGMPLTFRFPACLLDPDSWQGGSVNALKVHLSWQAAAVIDTTVSNSYGYASFKLWDSDVTGLAGVSVT